MVIAILKFVLSLECVMHAIWLLRQEVYEDLSYVFKSISFFATRGLINLTSLKNTSMH